MLGPEKVKQLLEQALSHSKADQTEVIFSATDSALTRFANNYIHQNVAETDAVVRVRVVAGKRVGVAETNDLTAEAIRRTVETARAIAQLQPENPEFKGLPPPQPIRPVEAFVSRTAEFSPEARARVVATICRLANEQRANAAGAFRTESYELAVANSLGIFAYHPGTRADLHTVVSADSATGYAAAFTPDARELNGEKLAREAIGKALRARNPIAMEPGEYTVVLEEYAVSDLLHYLGVLSFHALAVQESRSFMKDQFGQAVMNPAITMWDDGLAVDSFAVPFDFEGVPKQKVVFVEKGIARGVTYDSDTAAKEGKASTGHSLPAPNTIGPIPMHTFLAPGDQTKEELIRSITRGVLVTRFWYTRVVHPLRVVMTGMTRDGTFLIENGEVSLPLKSLRFTTSYVDALNQVRAIGRETKLMRESWFGDSQRVPALAVDGFNFTGVTQ